MGQKVSPIGYRIGVNKDWESKWYAGKDYAEKLNKDTFSKADLLSKDTLYFIDYCSHNKHERY